MNGGVGAVLIYFIYHIITDLTHALAEVDGDGVYAAHAEHGVFRLDHVDAQHAVSLPVRRGSHCGMRARRGGIPGDGYGGVEQAALVVLNGAAYAAHLSGALIGSGGIQNLRDDVVFRNSADCGVDGGKTLHRGGSHGVSLTVLHGVGVVIGGGDLVGIPVAVDVVGSAVAVEVVIVMNGYGIFN